MKRGYLSQDQTGGKFWSCDFSSGLLTPKSKPSVSRFSNYRVFFLSVFPDSPAPLPPIPEYEVGAEDRGVGLGKKHGSEAQLPAVLCLKSGLIGPIVGNERQDK